MSESVTVPTILEHSGDVPIVEIRHILDSGTAQEPAEVVGVGRIALRLLRRGAGNLGRRELDESIDRIAAMISAQASPDFYALHIRTLKKHLERAVELFASILHEPLLAADELERLKRETLAEIVSSRDDDRHLASRALRMLVFDGHPYGQASRGSIGTVERITMEHVREYLDMNLRRSNFLVGAAGDIEDGELTNLLGRTVGTLPEGATATKRELERPTMKPGIRVLLVDKPERVQTQIFLGHLGPSVSDVHDLPLRVALTAFGGTFTSKLMQEVRVKRGWSYGAYANLGRAKVPEALSLWTFPAMKDAAPCLQLLLDLFTALHEDGPAEEEVAFARDYLARGIALQRDTASARLTLKLRQRMLGLPEDYYENYAERVRGVTLEQAVTATKESLDPKNLAIAITCTADELRDQVAEVVGDDAIIDTIPYDSPLL